MELMNQSIRKTHGEQIMRVLDSRIQINKFQSTRKVL